MWTDGLVTRCIAIILLLGAAVSAQLSAAAALLSSAQIEAEVQAITPAVVTKIRALHDLAQQRGATLAQFATLWLLRRPEITTVLIGASKVAQIDDIHAGLKLPPLSPAEQAEVEKILAG